MTAEANLRRSACAALVVALTVALAGSPARAASTAYVHAVAFSFVPQDVTIAPGDSVQWDNQDNVTHSLTDRSCVRAGGSGTPCLFDVDLAPAQIHTVAFQTPGVYEYKCVIHDLFGTVTVVGDGALLPNLVIDSVSTSMPSPTVMRITGVIRNIGEAGAPKSEVVFRYRSGDTWRVIGAPLANALLPGASHPINVLWNIAGKAGDFAIEVVADGNTQVLESHEDDNARAGTASVLLPAGVVSPGLDPVP